MKKPFTLLAAIALAGCTIASDSSRMDELRKPDHLRTERNLPMTFPEIQMALFKHQDICGSGPEFQMKEGETSYATVMERDGANMPWNEVILFDLTWLKGSWRADSRSRVRVYSFYSDSDVRRRIDAVFKAITKPEECGEE